MKAQRRILLALVALFFLLFAACGGDDDSDDDGVASIDDDTAEDSEDDESDGGDGEEPTEQEFQDAMLEYAQCMRDNGVDMADPEFGEGGSVTMGSGSAQPGNEASEQAFNEADEKCKPIIDAVAPQTQLSPEEQAELQDQMLEVAECMRGKGHDMPDPEVDENGNVAVRMEAGEGEPEPGGAEGPSEEFQTDMTACEEEAGVERPGPGGADEEEDS